MVPHEDERHGPDEVRRDAKKIRLRKPPAVKDHNDHEARQCAVFLALAAARPRVSGARGRKRSARIALGSEPAQVGREEQEKSPSLSLPGVRRPQSFRRSPVSPLLAAIRPKILGVQLESLQTFKPFKPFENKWDRFRPGIFADRCIAIFLVHCPRLIAILRLASTCQRK
jgi:hypothetical protein